MKPRDVISQPPTTTEQASGLPADFAGRVLMQLPAADRARRRRRVGAIARPPVAALAVALLISLLNLTTLPAFGADGARTATTLATWLVVGYSVWTNFARAYLDFLGLSALPIVTAGVLFVAIVVATLGRGRTVIAGTRRGLPTRGSLRLSGELAAQPGGLTRGEGR